MCGEQGRLQSRLLLRIEFESRLKIPFFNHLRRHALVLKIMTGISLLGASGFNISMQYPKNEIFIGISFAVMGGAGLACLPLMNELIVETTYPAGEATSIGIPVWLTSPLSGALVALSSVIPYSDPSEYPDSVCREGETQDLSWFLSIMIGIAGVYYLFFVYFYRKFNQFSMIPKTNRIQYFRTSKLELLSWKCHDTWQHIYLELIES